MSFELANKILILNPHANVDKLYGVYNSIAEALLAVVPEIRMIGRTVGVIENGSIVEYWFKDGVTNTDLIIKNNDDSLQEQIDAEIVNRAIADAEKLPLTGGTLSGSLSIDWGGETGMFFNPSSISVIDGGTGTEVNDKGVSYTNIIPGAYTGRKNIIKRDGNQLVIGEIEGPNTAYLKLNYKNALTPTKTLVVDSTGRVASITGLPWTKADFADLSGFATASALSTEITDRQDADNLKLDKVTQNISAPNTEFKYVDIRNEENEGRRVLAGDLGKNIANSNLTSITGAGMNLGAPYTWATNGQPFSVTGLADKSADATYNQFITKNSTGQLGTGNGRTLALNMPNYMTPAEKNQWFANMNSETSFSGTSIITVVPPVITRSEIAQNIVIKGLGLNLVTNFDETPENNRSYVGIYPDFNNNGTQQPDEVDIPAINYSRVGDNQTIIGQFLLNSTTPLGKYKLKVKNAGIPAISDAYINLVNNLTNIPYVAGEIRLISGTSTLNTFDETGAQLIPDANIKAIGGVTTGLTDPIVNWVDGNVLNGADDWWFVYKIENNTLNVYGLSTFIGRIGLASSQSTSFINPEIGLINVYNFGTGHAYRQSSSVSIQGGPALHQTGNLCQVNYMKIGNFLTILLIGANGTTHISTILIDISLNYRLVAVLNNTSGSVASEADLKINKIKLSKLN